MKCGCEDGNWCREFYDNGTKKRIVKDEQGIRIENTPIRQCEKFRQMLREFLKENGVQGMRRD